MLGGTKTLLSRKVLFKGDELLFKLNLLFIDLLLGEVEPYSFIPTGLQVGARVLP